MKLGMLHLLENRVGRARHGSSRCGRPSTTSRSTATASRQRSCWRRWCRSRSASGSAPALRGLGAAVTA